jgi:hypothetical protein
MLPSSIYFILEAEIYSNSLTTEGGLHKVEMLLQKQKTRRSKLSETRIMLKKQV